MITADSMRKLADDANDADNTKVNEILGMIRAYAENGNYDTFISGHLSPTIKNTLKDRGFHIESFGPHKTYISWR